MLYLGPHFCIVIGCLRSYLSIRLVELFSHNDPNQSRTITAIREMGTFGAVIRIGPIRRIDDVGVDVFLSLLVACVVAVAHEPWAWRFGPNENIA